MIVSTSPKKKYVMEYAFAGKMTNWRVIHPIRTTPHTAAAMGANLFLRTMRIAVTS